MTINEAYIKFLQKVNKNLNSNNIVADKGRFILLYREAEIKRIVDLTGKKNDERHREIQWALKPNISLSFNSKITDRVLYNLPTDYLELSSAYATASKGSCKDKQIFLREIKDANYNEYLPDNYNQASFEYREAPYMAADKKINIFTNDFEIQEVILTYYRYPRKVDIAGYLNANGVPSTNINPEGEERFIDKVLSLAAEDFARNNYDADAVQINKDRIQTNT
jgi:hypothetical protein